MNLRIQGFKSVDRSIDLERLNLIIGPNGAGKSAIADALRFLALGYVPALGKREQDTALLMSNGRLEVTLTLDDNRTATRTLERDGEGYRSTVRASWVRGSRAEHDAGILALFGSDAEDVAEALDIRELLSLSPAKRAARIEKMVGSGATGSLPARVARLHVARLLEQDVDQLPEKLSDAIAVLPPSRTSALRGIGKTVTTMLHETGIPGVIAWANEAKREAEGAAKKRKAARDEIEGRLQTMGGIHAIDTLEAKRTTVLQQQGAVREQSRREGQRSTQLEAATKEHVQTEGVLGDAVDQLERIEQTAAEMIETCEANIPAYDEAIGALRAQTFGTHVDTRRIEQLEGELAGLTDEPVEDATRYERMIEDFEAELAQTKASPWAEVKTIAAELMLAVGSDVNPIHWSAQRLMELADTNMPSTADTEAGLAAARETLTKRGDLAAAAAQRNVEREGRRSTLEGQLKDLRTQAAGVETSISARERKRDSEIEQLEAKKKSARAVMVDQTGKVTAQRVHISELREKLAGLASRILTLNNTAAPEIQGVDEGELERIETAIAAATQRKALGTELQSIIDELEERDAEVDVYRALEWALQTVRAEELGTTGAGIVAAIGNFLRAAGRSEQPYMESSKNVCSVGWVNQAKQRVSIEALSGGEYALYCAALTAAVLCARGGELRVLMIEGAEADTLIIQQIMEGIESVSAVTHALVLSAHFPAGSSSDWSISELEAVAQERAA